MKKIKLTVFLSLLIFESFSQTFDLPDLQDLLKSVDEYYNELSVSQQKENEETTKLHWLSYIPTPSYSPFQGGFGISINLTAPLQELNRKNNKKLKNEAIVRLNHLQAKDVKNQISFQYQSIEISIDEFISKNLIDSLKIKSYNLTQKQYIKNDLTPTEFLSAQQTFELYNIQRLSEKNVIKKSIIQLLINAKKAAVETSDLSIKP